MCSEPTLTRALPQEHRPVAQPDTANLACSRHEGEGLRPGRPGTGGSGMWDTIRDAIQSNGRTLRLIAIITALALVTWLLSPY